MARNTNDNLGTGTVISGVGKMLEDTVGFFIILIFGVAVLPVISLITWGAYLLVKLLTF